MPCFIKISWLITCDVVGFFKTFVEWVDGPGGQDDLAFIVFTNGFWSISWSFYIELIHKAVFQEELVRWLPSNFFHILSISSMVLNWVSLNTTTSLVHFSFFVWFMNQNSCHQMRSYWNEALCSGLTHNSSDRQTTAFKNSCMCASIEENQ